MSFSHILKLQAKRYPAMELSDFARLAFQSEFGSGCLAGETALQDLRAEFALAQEEGYAPAYTVEALGSALCRFHLDSRRLQEEDLELLARYFCVSARPRGSRRNLWEKLGVISGLAWTGELPFSVEDWEDFLEKYDTEGCPAPSHSEAYQTAYRPHYRVIDRDLAVYTPALRVIETALRRGGPVMVAVDGRCAAGKTFFAARLRDLYGDECAVFHMDHYFLPPEKRTPERLAAPGGNVDYERCAEELLSPLSRGEPLFLRSFNCGTGLLEEVVEARGKRLNVLEGSYSLHPALAGYSQVHLFLTCSPRVQTLRLERRETEENLERYREEWIPLEESYFEGLRIPEQCDAVIDTSRLVPVW